MPKEEMMKTNKVTKFGISLLSVAALGVVTPALTDNPVFGISVVKADESQEPLNFRITYRDIDSGEEISAKMIGVLYPGQSVNIYKEISGYQIVSNYEWMPNYNASYDVVSMYFYGANGYNDMYLNYRKLEPTPTPTPEPAPTPGKDKDKENPKPGVKPETKPSETPKPEVKPETKPSETPKPEVKPETKPSANSNPAVKPATTPSEKTKPEVKPETTRETNSNTAPQAPVKRVGQDSNTKADKPVSKPETTALPNTGEQNSILGFAGFLLASLGLAGLTYKGRH